MAPKEDFKDIEMRFKNKLEVQMGGTTSVQDEIDSMQGASMDDVEIKVSSEYDSFKRDMLPGNPDLYEKLCRKIGGLVTINCPPKQKEEFQGIINTCYLNVTPDQMYSFAIMGPVLLMLCGILASVILGTLLMGSPSMFFMIFSVIMSVLMIQPMLGYPKILETSWKMKASNQMVLCIFYVVTHMRHTSNIEHAIDFASQHLSPPLSIDLKKVLWDVETNKFESVRESLTAYLERWRESNLEFVEGFNLILSSLYESSEDRRVSLLDKSLDVILEETFEKMLHYAQNLQGPITMLHMLGVIMPILGLVILPLVATFMDNIRWYHLAALYNIILPVWVYYKGQSILITRPSGYGDSDISEVVNKSLSPENIAAEEVRQKKVKMEGFMLFFMFFLIGILPLAIHFVDPTLDFEFGASKFEMIGYKEAKGGGDTEIGPYGIGALFASLMIPLGVGLGIAHYYKGNTAELVKVREETKALEKEFASGLFQLGNRIGDGIPAEIAFGKVAQVMEGTRSADFFNSVHNNIARLGYGVHEALFNEKVGAIVSFPSNMIKSSMKVLVESSKKGPGVASTAILNVARYIKEIHRVEERLADLMAETISSMNQQIAFMTPVISGIVVGITSMISTIIGKLQTQIACLSADSPGGGVGLLEIMSDGIPPYYFQFVVGFYVVELAFVLTILSNGIQNGSDDLNKRYMLANNLKGSVMKYCILSSIIILIFNLIAGSIVSGALQGC